MSSNRYRGMQFDRNFYLVKFLECQAYVIPFQCLSSPMPGQFTSKFDNVIEHIVCQHGQSSFCPFLQHFLIRQFFRQISQVLRLNDSVLQVVACLLLHWGLGLILLEGQVEVGWLGARVLLHHGGRTHALLTIQEGGSRLILRRILGRCHGLGWRGSEGRW